MWMGPPKELDWPKPMSSISTISTFGAFAGACTTNLGGGVAFRTLSTVLCGYCGSGNGNTVRSVGSTIFAAAAGCWDMTGWDNAARRAAQPPTTERTIRLTLRTFMFHLQLDLNLFCPWVFIGPVSGA